MAVLPAILAACGCDAVGYPAVDVSVVEDLTGVPVTLAGATISSRVGNEATFSEQRPPTDTISRFNTCCSPGVWFIQIAKPGYVDYDTSVTVQSKGRCERPVLVRLIARLERASSTRRANASGKATRDPD